MREFAATKAAQCLCFSGGSIEDGDMVISTFLVRFHVKFGELQFDPVTRSRGEEPGTVFPGRIRVRPVGADDLSRRCGDMVCAAALFAVMLVVVQHEAVVAGT
jgi:hypothetical protein